jgi:hypothetical protein
MLAFVLLLLAGPASAQNMKEGLWQITVTMEMPGMSMKMPPQTQTLCLSRKDVVPYKAEPGQECRLTKSDVKGDTVSWSMECKTGGGPAVFNGTVTYKGESFEGVAKMKYEGMDMTQNLKGKWVGPCPK